MTDQVTPRPDPTTLTTESLLREVGHARELVNLRFEQLDLRLQQRFEAQQKAIDAALISADVKAQALAEKLNDLSADIRQCVSRQEYLAQQQKQERAQAFIESLKQKAKIEVLV